MEEKTLCLLKPDLVQRHLIGEAIKELEKYFTISKMELQSFTVEKIQEFYEEHKNKAFFPQLVEFMKKGPIVALELKGENAIKKLRELIGNLNPALAEKGTLRNQFGISIDENSFHGSDSENSARRELSIMFKEKHGI